MVNFFNPGGNREFTGNRGGWNPIRTSGQFYGGPSQVQGGGMGGFGGMGGGGAPR